MKFSAQVGEHLILQSSFQTAIVERLVLGIWARVLVFVRVAILSPVIMCRGWQPSQERWEVVLLLVSISFIFQSDAPPSIPQTTHPPTHPLPRSLHELPPVFLYFSFPSSPSPSPSPSFPACLFSPLPSPLLPPVLSFSAKRLAGVFSTVVTFKTECHHCLSRSLSSLPLTCLSLCPLLLLCTPSLPPLSSHPPPAARAFWTECCA